MIPRLGFSKQTTRVEVSFYNLDAPRVALQKRDMFRTTAQRFNSHTPRTRTKIQKISIHYLFLQNTKNRFFNPIGSRADEPIPFRSRQASASECASNNPHFLPQLARLENSHFVAMDTFKLLPTTP
jgi:hypothetical protein